MEFFDLTGRVAVVTGGNGGIGLGFARGLARAGASVAIAGCDAAKTEIAVRELRTIGVPAIGIAADLRRTDDCERLVAETVEHFGRLDILVNDAARDLTAAVVCARAAYPHFRAAGGGKIINVGAVRPPDAARQDGLTQMTRDLARDWAKDNIQANAVLPAWVDPEPCRHTRRAVQPGPPAGRWGDPSDFEGLAVFLASRASDFMNGAALPMDGGYAALA